MTDLELQKLATEERKRYYKEWRAKNKERIRLTNARYWAKRALKAKEAKEAEEAENNV